MTNVANEKTPFELVVEFNQQILGIQPRPLALLSGPEYEITSQSLREEINEFEESWARNDIIQSIDGLIDTIYFAIGALYKTGLSAMQIKECFNVVHNANMNKKRGVNERRGDGEVADAVKPEAWKSPEEYIAIILDSSI